MFNDLSRLFATSKTHFLSESRFFETQYCTVCYLWICCMSYFISGGTWDFNGDEVWSRGLLAYDTLKMEATRFSETLVSYHVTAKKTATWTYLISYFLMHRTSEKQNCVPFWSACLSLESGYFQVFWITVFKNINFQNDRCLVQQVYSVFPCFHFGPCLYLRHMGASRWMR